MEQVNGLSDKIRDELVSLASRAAEMQNEMGMLNDIEGLKTREAQTKQVPLTQFGSRSVPTDPVTPSSNCCRSWRS